MNNVDRIFAGHSGAAQFAGAYADYFGTLLRGLDNEAVSGVIDTMLEARAQGEKILFIGNYLLQLVISERGTS